ncbi:MAG TPA: hypothetical protein VNE39_11895 [Planctomycetota bacterium]|nr:hypothetical protein [Planctomycetota bacterium]
MKDVIAFVVLLVFIQGCAGQANNAASFADRIRGVLPNDWSAPTSRSSEEPGTEGIYIFAENAQVTLDGPKGKYHPHIDLYFRPRTSRTKCFQIIAAGCIYSRYLGSTREYHVYGGSIGASLDAAIQEALELNEESWNNRMAHNQ